MASQSPPQLSLSQLLTVPVFAAVVSGSLALAARSGLEKTFGIVTVIFWVAIGLPAALAITAMVLLRPGRGRERLVAILLAASGLALAVALLAIGFQAFADIGSTAARGDGVPVDLIALEIVILGALLALRSGLLALWSRIRPGRCPVCGRPAGEPDRDAPDPGGLLDGNSSWAPEDCASCSGIDPHGTPSAAADLSEPPGESGLPSPRR
ncbi:hypothetical protein [Tautonia sociabilis]|uniref:Uncharacterized protein n=1 Tax=Tautonia sociabilis TaxID=2080755 RepID=A0A432MQR4_9BACT|nr:hypothetical protein [Tautonia sociabilis]RUL89385.1 hypothetical protein TsocGM_02970 [Tautonia sociabilis]